MVEHDEDTMYAADCIIDIGPKAGAGGGEVVAQGTVEEIKQNLNSITGQYLSRRKYIPVPKERRKGNGNFIEVVGAKENNLKNINVKIPTGVLTCVTGVSGSGKSTLANEVEKRLVAMGKHTMLLDGDNVRMGLNNNLGFSDEDRVENIRRIAEGHCDLVRNLREARKVDDEKELLAIRVTVLESDMSKVKHQLAIT